jgi:hypothetical protein
MQKLRPFVVLAWLGACAPQPQVPAASVAASGADTTVGIDAKFGETTSDAKAADGAQLPGDASASGSVWLTFEIDDSANQTFGNGDIRWTGSFAWDAKTNTVVYATSWLPQDGPYPPLWDDGPLSKSGHEHEAAKAGDHVFSTAVKFVATADTKFEYGALNEFDNWMWQGPNGALEVKAGATGVVAAKGMKLAKFGSIDVKFALDTKALHPDFAKWTTKTHTFWIKGSMNQWTPVQLLDDGQKGDDKADDGVLTYVHKLNLGKHDGLLNGGDEVQFVFLTTIGDGEPSAGLEYKGPKQAHKAGVLAWTATGKGGAWAQEAVIYAKDSKGSFENTAVIVPSPGTPVDECLPTCKTGETCLAGKCVVKPGCEPVCKASEACVDGKCVGKPEPLKVVSVEPSKGPAAGGTAVTMKGTGFQAGAVVRFGGAAASDVVVAAGGSSLACKTPAHEPGLVAVEVENPNSVKAVLADAFAYDKPAATGPTLTAVEPVFAAAKGGSTVTLVGENLAAEFEVHFQTLAGAAKPKAKSVKVVQKGLEVVAPELAVGAADVQVTKPGAAMLLKLPAALDFVPLDTPTTLDGTLGDWHPFSLAGVSTIPTTWGAGKNELTQAWAAYDAGNLYLGLQGFVEPTNAIVVYVDVDAGDGTGVASPAYLKDNAGPLDDAIAGVLGFEGGGWGIDFAFGTVGMASFAGGDAGQSKQAGWRALQKIDDFAWLTAPVVVGADKKSLEAAIPLTTLYPNGIPATGHTLQWLAVIVNADGSAVSNQFLPVQESQPKPTVATKYGKLRIYQAN